MAGRKQHYIPQCLLRAFAESVNAKKHYVRVFKKGKDSYSSSTEGVAAERHFYSEIAIDDSKTLDDQITEFETTLGPLLAAIRKTPDGQTLSQDLVSKVIVHLAIRNAHIRESFEAATNILMGSFRDVLSNESALRNLLEIDAGTPPQILIEEFDKTINSSDSPELKNVPKPLLHKMLHVYVRERFSDFWEQGAETTQEFATMALGNIPEIVRNAHRKALENGLAPPERISKIAHFNWQVYTINDEKLILPDCVVLARGKSADVLHPFAINELDEVTEILFPVSPNKLVIGSAEHPALIEGRHFNEMSASCCSTFFVAAEESDKNNTLRTLIGTYIEETIIPLATETIEELTKKLPQNKSSQNKLGELPDLAQHPESIPVTFPPGIEPTRAKVIAEAVTSIVIEVAKSVPLKNLHSIAFIQTEDPAKNPPSIIRKGITVACAGDDFLPHLVADSNVQKFRAILHMETGEALGSFESNNQNSQTALYVSLFQLCFAGHREKIRHIFHPVADTSNKDPWNNALLSCIECTVGAYFSALYCAPLVPSADIEISERLLFAIDLAQSQIADEKMRFKEHKNLDQLAFLAIRSVGAILWYAAKLVGHSHGTEKQELLNHQALKLRLGGLDLLHWIKIFESDLMRARASQGSWKTIDDLLPLGIHLERLLWPFSVFSWRDDSGQTQLFFRY